LERNALFRERYRLVFCCLIVGAFGAFAALGFDWLVAFAEKHLLVSLTGFVPPEQGVLNPLVRLPDIPSRIWIPIVTTLGGLVGGFIVFKWAPEAEGHGTDAAINSYHQEGGVIRNRVPLIKAVASALTIGSGGVAGREGPTAQIAVGMGSIFGKLTGLRGNERRIVLLAAMAAGLAAIFQAPLGMAIFAVEILYSDMVFESEALIYTVISAVTAYAIHGFFAGWSPLFAIPADLGFRHPEMLILYAVLGITAGAFGSVLPGIFYGIRDLFNKIPGPPHLKPALGGLGVGLIGMFFPYILGTGYGWVELSMTGSLPLFTLLLILALKIPAMGLTIGSGGSGGVFGPTVVVGASLGAVAGTLFDQFFPQLEINVASFVVVGMAAIFAGAARTPISTLIMVAEMTSGYALIVPAMLANVLSFMIQHSVTQGWRYPTLYLSQVPNREDSPVHQGVFIRRAVGILEDGKVDYSQLTLPRLVSLLRFGEPVHVTKESDEVLVGLEIQENSPLAESTISEGIGEIKGATAVALLRQHKIVVPRGPTVIEPGDQLIALATPAARNELTKRASGKTAAS